MIILKDVLELIGAVAVIGTMGYIVVCIEIMIRWKLWGVTQPTTGRTRSGGCPPTMSHDAPIAGTVWPPGGLRHGSLVSYHSGHGRLSL
jgi:hypothetical protein